MEEKRNSFRGSLGFVLAAASSAVGLGNIWRFPYLAAKDGGGLFLVVYIILAVTFGFALLTAEIAIGRKTKQSPLTAYSKLKKGWKPLGVIGCLVPAIIMPYYSAIGGWVIKYFTVYLTNQGSAASQDGYFSSFLGDTVQPIVFMALFLAACAVIILMGVNKGIEKSSKVLMPALLLLVIAISIFSLTIKFTAADGSVRTGLQGLKIYLVPSVAGMSFSSFLGVILDASGQLFFSLSVAMGIMIAYGSYVSDDANLVKSINQIEIFDTLVAFLAGVMIIPAVYAFAGTEGMEASGPSLMFITLPKVFTDMGFVGNIIGLLFFAMVFFAALTSGVSIYEAIVSSVMDQFNASRKKSTVFVGLYALIFGAAVCLGYNKLYFEVKLPTGSTGQILDILDYISNNILMPVGAIGTCILVGWIIKPKTVIDEVTKNGEKFSRKYLFIALIKFVVPAILLILLFKSLGFFS